MIRLPKRELCKLKKEELRVLLPELVEHLVDGKYVCRKCARIAHEKSLVCKPVKVSELRSKS
ncbi:MAG TPA: hypothetical protein DDW52_16450 [Planctomycetaceae bacterium]|nr:hypothetical protein [Planctomycetaceae bacterium]